MAHEIIATNLIRASELNFWQSHLAILGRAMASLENYGVL